MKIESKQIAGDPEYHNAKDCQVWCEEENEWYADISDFMEHAGDHCTDPATYNVYGGKKVDLSKYVKADVVIENLDDYDELTNSDYAMYPSDAVSKEDDARLQALLEDWARTIDYQFFQPDKTVAHYIVTVSREDDEDNPAVSDEEMYFNLPSGMD